MLLQAPHFYDLSLLGLKWLSESRDRDIPEARSLSPIFYSLRDAGIIEEKQRSAAMRDARLRMRITRHLELCQTTLNHTRRQALESAINSSVKHLALMPPENEPYSQSRVVRKNGYKFFLTNAGLAYAERKEGPYANIITADAFLDAWQSMRERVATIMASQHARQPKAAVLRGSFGSPIDLSTQEMESEVA